MVATPSRPTVSRRKATDTGSVTGRSPASMQHHPVSGPLINLGHTMRLGVFRSARLEESATIDPDGLLPMNLIVQERPLQTQHGTDVAGDAAVRLGLKQREERHWGAFFLGLIVGAAVGALVAMLTTPKPGTEMREELATKAREAGDWVPIFQRDEGSGATADFATAESAIGGVALAETVAGEAGSELPPAEAAVEPIDAETISIPSTEELDERT